MIQYKEITAKDGAIFMFNTIEESECKGIDYDSLIQRIYENGVKIEYSLTETSIYVYWISAENMYTGAGTIAFTEFLNEFEYLVIELIAVNYLNWYEKLGFKYVKDIIEIDEETPMGVWINAKLGETGKDENHVKSKLGDLALRGGWHLNENVPFVNHIGRKNEDGRIAYLFEDHVWCEVEYSNMVDYQALAYQNGINEKGKFIPKNAYIKEVPLDGFYRYKTNSNQREPWIIAGAIKVNRVLSDQEVYDICAAKGLRPLLPEISLWVRILPRDSRSYGIMSSWQSLWITTA